MLSMLLMGLVLAAQEPGAEAPKKEAAQDAAADSPERAIRSFILALMTKDVPALKAVTLPADDLEKILPPQAVPAESLDAFKEQVAQLPVRLLKAGEEVELIDGQTYKARAEDVGTDCAVVLPQGAAFPLASRRVDGRWKVDVSPSVESMKGAANSKPAPPPKPVDVAPIKDKVVIKPDQEFQVQFARQGDVLSAPKVLEAPKDGAAPEAKAEAVHFDFSKEGDNLTLATRNPYPKNLIFRAAIKHKGRKGYVETSIVPVRAGIFGIEMWRDPIEELVLFDFKLEADKP